MGLACSALELKVQGGSTAAGTIEIRDAGDLGRCFETADVVEDSESPSEILWNFRIREDLGACPTRVRATQIVPDNGAFGKADVTIR